MLELTGTQSTIKTIPFNVQSIGTALSLARVEHINGASPSNVYTIPLLLNQGSQGANQGNEWIAAIVKVSPIEPKLSYELDDSSNFTPEQKEEYQKLFEAALKYDDGFHQAFPNVPIAQCLLKELPRNRMDILVAIEHCIDCYKNLK